MGSPIDPVAIGGGQVSNEGLEVVSGTGNLVPLASHGASSGIPVLQILVAQASGVESF